MRVFVTGASGFVGSAIVSELLSAGHRVLGLARSDKAAAALQVAGADVYRGDLEDPESLKAGAAACDAVIHTAFNHDFSRFKDSCEEDRVVINTLGIALAGLGCPLLVTSGIGLLRSEQLLTEADQPPGSDTMPRAASEEAAAAVAATGVPVYIVRLPPTVHGPGDHGFVPMLIGMAREKGVSAFIGEGANKWPAVHRLDAARLYRLILEQQPEQKVFHAVAETGIPFRDIAGAIGQGLGLPIRSVQGDAAGQHFGWFSHFAAMDCQASAAQTRDVLQWTPAQNGLMAELVPGIYF